MEGVPKALTQSAHCQDSTRAANTAGLAKSRRLVKRSFACPSQNPKFSGYHTRLYQNHWIIILITMIISSLVLLIVLIVLLVLGIQ